MSANNTYHEGLLYLIYLIISADNIIDKREIKALHKIRELEEVPENIYNDFMENIENETERSIYSKGIDLISRCSLAQKKRAFAWLYKIAEVDGNVHIKEVRFLLYSFKKADIEFMEIVDAAEQLPKLTI
ncbi:MAG: hypothetical protein OEX02_02710 [Cyclobacteriaceae bacterium]|nr:hypothetical protein [Cyclobacteriaceae bacterium]